MTPFLSSLDTIAREGARCLPDAPVFGDLARGTVTGRDYERWLVQTYHYVSVTSPFLDRAAARIEREGRHPELAALCREKAEEEAGHEAWALRDLHALGGGAPPATLAGPTPAVEAYIAWNRFTVETGAPVAFLGTAFFLEHLAATSAGGIVERLVARGTVPGIARALTFLRGHAASDGPHLSELVGALSRVGDPDDREAILLSARTTAALYPRFFVDEPGARPEQARGDLPRAGGTLPTTP